MVRAALFPVHLARPVPLLFVVLACVALTSATAQAVPGAEIWLSAAGVLDGSGIDGGPEYSSAGARVFLDSGRSESVRASLAVSLSSDGTVLLERAWLRTRLPLPGGDAFMRFSAGKMPLSWGRGFFFNAADSVFGELPSLTGLASSEYRISADWMAVFLLPLGAFSFIEAVYLPEVKEPGWPFVSPSGDGRAPRGGSRAGSRIGLSPGWYLLNSIEASWLFSESGGSRFGLSAEGSVWVDWYASAAVDADGKNWSASAGIFRSFDWFRDVPLSLRSELITHPEEQNLACFAVLQAGFADIYSLSLQGLFAAGGRPVHPALPHGSGMATAALSIVPLSGFTLEANLSRLYGTPSGNMWILGAGTRLRY